MDCSFLNDLTINAWLLAQNGTDAADQGISWDQVFTVVGALAVMVLPFFAGSFLAKTLKMPTHATRFGCVLLAMVASTVVLSKGEIKRGVDLKGGTILVYEIAPGKVESGPGGAPGIVSEDLVEPLTKRINPSGTQEIIIRPYGLTQIEIIVPAVDDREVGRIKRLIEEAGILRFAIVANRADHKRQIDLATTQSESKSKGTRTREIVTDEAGLIVGRWANVDREKSENVHTEIKPLKVDVSGAIVRNPDTGEMITFPPQVYGENAEYNIAKWLQDNEMSGIETLMIVDPQLDIKGEDLAFASSTFDQMGAPAVSFNLTDSGSGKFFALTANNSPDAGRQRQLGIVLDDNLLSAPNILQPIRKEGRITGRFTRAEVDDLVAILKAGQLPAALTKQPIAENQIDATLGADTIRKGENAIAGSLALVLVFILCYYMFAGVVACIALVLNLAMILATMVLINQPLTLPGLAGLVLTVGMSVDANVLIFERIREELKKGAAARMAIRNGFAKATVTIVDANLTTLITAIVLYAIGTDQIRGFAVTLILGILFSMFTAIYMSRLFFDLAERRGFLSLFMFDGVNSVRKMLSVDGVLDFIGKGTIALGFSGVLIAIGMTALYGRGEGILDIDFAGGSSVQFRLEKPATTDQVRAIVDTAMLQSASGNESAEPGDAEGAVAGGTVASEKTVDVEYTVNSVDIEGVPLRTVFKVDSGFDKVDKLKAAITKAFAESSEASLVTYDVEIVPEGQSRVDQSANGIMLTALNAQVEDADTATATQSDTATVVEATAVEAAPVVDVNSTRIVVFGIHDPSGSISDTGGAPINEATLIELLVTAAKDINVPLAERLIELAPQGDGTEEWKPDSSLPFAKWKVGLPVDAAEADKVMNEVKRRMDSDPVWISSSSVGSRVAGDMKSRAFGALFASLLCIIGYIWFRFQRVVYGLAAVAALLHDVLITLGAIAASAWLADSLGFLMIDPFKISLTVVAALLTIIGYSLNDTIVVFDRIRETKGKAPRLTGEMINSSISQTLSRTLLTSLTTLLVVVLLYFFGGEGIHTFAFSLVVGVIAGTYSSIFVASPILLWLLDRQERSAAA